MNLIGEKLHDRKQLQWTELQDKLADAVTDKKNVGAILSDMFFMYMMYAYRERIFMFIAKVNIKS